MAQVPPIPAIPYAQRAGFPASGATGPLSSEHLTLIISTRARLKGVRRAVSMARFDAITLGLFALITLATGFTSPVTLLLGIAMAVVTFVELKAANKLLLLDPTAPRILAANQLLLASALIVYATYSLLCPAALPKEIVDSQKDLQSLGIDLGEMIRSANNLIYGSLIAIAFFVQGSMAYYYFSKEKRLNEVLNSTPHWVLEMVRGLGA